MKDVQHDRFMQLNGNPEKRTYQKHQETDVNQPKNNGKGKGGGKGGGKRGGTRKKVCKENLSSSTVTCIGLALCENLWRDACLH